MGKAGAGTPKAIANAIKAKGLGRLRWYCQICEKQCRDENGFQASLSGHITALRLPASFAQAHARSEPHLRKMMLVGPKAGSAISDFSRQFQNEFVTLLRTRHQTNRVRANAVYNEYIQDKHHVHMNATRWVTLNGFVMTLGKAGTVKVDEDEKGLWIMWAALQKRDRAQMDGEERERLMLAEQIERARANQANKQDDNAGLQKKEGEKVSLNLFGSGGGETNEGESAAAEAGPSRSNGEIEPGDTQPEVGASAPAESPKATGISFSSTPTSSVPAQPASIALNPLKRPAPVNVFKQSKAARTEPSENGSSVLKKGYMSEAERLMKEDQQRKMNRAQGYGGFGPKRDTGREQKRFVLQ